MRNYKEDEEKLRLETAIENKLLLAKLDRLERWLDTFHYSNDIVTIKQIRNILDPPNNEVKDIIKTVFKS